jgi:signal transduction histidine kinase
MPDRADNEAMANRERARRAAAKDARDHPNIEPGLLRIFRWYVAIRLSFGVLVLWSVRSEPDRTNPRFPGGGVFFFSLLMVLLVWPWAQRKLGRLFLPATLALATLGPIVESAQNITGRLDGAVIAWAVVTTLLDAGSAIPPLEEAGADMAILTALVLARGALFAFVGLFVVKLIGGQRDARKSLATHAATLEELATSRERNRLARELHDTLAHSLSATAVQLEAVKALWDEEADRAKEMLDQSLQRARGGLGEARRAIQALRASPLDERGLAGALDQLGAAAAARSSIEIQVTVDDRVGELGPQLEQAIYRIADEALTNVVCHSGATAAALELKKARNRLSLEVVDNGSGFELDVPAGNGHVGLQGMRERAELVGGSLDVDSRLGGGTTVRFDVRTSK